MEQLSSLEASMLSLVKLFVERQAIVLDTMRDLRPDIIMQIEKRDNSEFWAGWTRESWQAFVLENIRKPATGYWGDNNEWAYFLHGGGCRLTHTKTGEIIQWDAGSLRRFDWHWFVDYLNWLLKGRFENNEDVRRVKLALHYVEVNDDEWTQQVADHRLKLEAQVFPILEQLVEKGFLSKKGQGTSYTLMT